MRSGHNKLEPNYVESEIDMSSIHQYSTIQCISNDKPSTDTTNLVFVKTELHDPFTETVHSQHNEIKCNYMCPVPNGASANSHQQDHYRSSVNVDIVKDELDINGADLTPPNTELCAPLHLQLDDKEALCEAILIPNEEETEKKIAWTLNNTNTLISLIEHRYEDMHHYKNRKTFWQSIESDLLSMDIPVDANHCRSKWNNLLRSYKQCIDNRNKTGRGPIKFIYFDQMDNIVGKKNNVAPTSAINDLDLDRTGETEEKYEATMIETGGSEVSGSEGVVESVNHTESSYRKRNDIKPKKKNYTAEYIKMKTKYFKSILVHKEEKRKLMQKKLDLEERKVVALEQLIKLREKQ